VKTVKAESSQFGEVDLKLADVRDLRFSGGFDVDLSKVEAAPAHLYARRSLGRSKAMPLPARSGGPTPTRSIRLWRPPSFTRASSRTARRASCG
jgi:hypothetical protein